MNCNRYEELIHLYVDHRLDKKEKEELIAHMETCTHCQETYEEIKALKDLLGGMEMKKLPEGFEQELHVKLLEVSLEKEENWMDKIKAVFMNRNKMKMAVSFGGIAIAAVLVVANSGLLPSVNQLKNGAYESSYEMSEEAPMDMAMETTAAPAMMSEPEIAPNNLRSGDIAVTFDDSHSVDGTTAGDVANYALKTEAVEQSVGAEVPGAESKVDKDLADQGPEDFKGRLIIKTANISMDVEKYDKTSEEIYRMVNEMGGYVSDTSSYYYIFDRQDESKNKKSGYMTLRIPNQFFDQFIAQMNQHGDVTTFSSNANDITKQYRDTTAEVKNLEVREAKLREIMDKAEEVKDIIQVERELSRVRGEINRYNSLITDWEDLVTLSTVTINMTEVEDLKTVVKPVDKDMITKAREGFIFTLNRIINALELFFVWLVSSSPVLIPVGIIGGLSLRKILKRWRK